MGMEKKKLQILARRWRRGHIIGVSLSSESDCSDNLLFNQHLQVSQLASLCDLYE